MITMEKAGVTLVAFFYVVELSQFKYIAFAEKC